MIEFGRSSRDGKEELCHKQGGVLIKSLVQSIPTYVMGCFLFPQAICKEIESLTARFFWRGDVEGRKPHWVSCKKLTNSKKEGGMGFRL